MKNDFIPLGNSNIDSFESNLLRKLAIYAPALGLNPEEISESVRIINEHRADFANMNSKRAESKKATEDSSNSRIRSVNEIRRLAKQIKSSKAYTSGIGDDLGIVGPDLQPTASSLLKPVLKATRDGQKVIITFKKEDTDGIKLHSRRGDETEFTLLDATTASPYSDTRPKLDPKKPEQREYYAYFFNTYIDTGQQSDVIKVVIP